MPEFPTAPLRVDTWSLRQTHKQPRKNGLDSERWSSVYTCTTDSRHASNMTIGAAAKRAAAGIGTTRYYERERRLPPPRRRALGYRDDDIAAVARLRLTRSGGGLTMPIDVSS